MSADWAPLRSRLAALRRAGIALPFWWRDDDAVTETPALESLERLAEDLDLEVHVAVIPDLADASLATRLVPGTPFVPVVHGWRHVNHAPLDARKAEFGRHDAARSGELAAGLARMLALFGPQVPKMFVPPWNRIDPGFFPDLVGAGYKGLSTFGPRPQEEAVPGLLRVNTHVDPIDWRGSRDLLPLDLLVAHAADLLERRLSGADDPAEPFGLLTHHLVHTARIWDFSRRFLSELLDGGARPQAIAPLLETRNEPT